jgi:hypothetical protein
VNVDDEPALLFLDEVEALVDEAEGVGFAWDEDGAAGMY